MSKPDKKIHYHCQCGRALEAGKRWFSKKAWDAGKCPVCHTVKDLSNAQGVVCPHCDHLVLKGEKFCPVCMQPVDVSTENVTIECPFDDCGVTIYLPKNYKGDYTCRYCEQVISAEKIRELLKDSWTQGNAPARLIELPSARKMAEEKRVVFQAEGSSFPRNSRVQVSEGTWGVLMQNGVSQYALSHGIHELAESGLSLSAKMEAAAKGEEMIFNTAVFCVAKKLPAVEHVISSSPVAAMPVGKAPARQYTVTADGLTIVCTVDDARTFLSRAGFCAMSENELLKEGGWLKTRTREVLFAAFNKAAHDAFAIWENTKSVYDYQTEILRHVKAQAASALASDGLCLESADIKGLDIAETAESKQAAEKYLNDAGKIEYVKLPDEQMMKAQKLVIYKHDKDEFTYQSRVQVSEGTYGLMFKNGACQDVLLPGSYLLADRNLDRGTQYEEAMRGENVTLTTTLFAMLKTLPAFEWYRAVTFIDLERDGGAPAHEYMVKAQGTITFRVDDAKAFAGVVGYRPLSVAELIHAKRPNGQLPMLNRDLEGSYPAESENGWLYEKILSTMNAILSGTCQAVFGDKLDTRRMDMYRLAFTRRLQDEFNALLSETGLTVTALNLSAFNAVETENSRQKQEEYKQKNKQRDAVLGAVQNRILWDARDITLHVRDALHMTASASFSGDCRVQVENEAAFLRLPEVAKAMESAAPESIAAAIKSKLEGVIRNKITVLAQQCIDSGAIADLENGIAYIGLTDYVRGELNRELAADGLSMQQFAMNTPVITASKALKDHKSIDEKKQKIKAYAESELKLQTTPIRVHVKDDATVYVMATFSGKAHLRVADENEFFATSEVQQFLLSDPFVSASAVTNYYTERLNGNFADITGRVVQAIVDQTNADIQELNRLSGLLQANLLNNLNDRANRFGMRLDSLDMGDPIVVEKSANMLTWVKRNETRSGNALDQEIQKLNNDKVIFEYGEDGRVTVAKLGIDDQTKAARTASELKDKDNADLIAEKAAEMRKREAERKFNEDMDRIRKQGELERLMDEVAGGKEDRDFERLQKEYQRMYMLQEAAINQAIRADQLRQQGDIDKKAREQKAQFDLMINDAENKRIITGIMRKIDESDLDWRKKLDEYARLQRRVSVEDQVALDELVETSKIRKQEESAMSGLRIQRAGNEVFMLVGNTRIQLADAEAELLEKIARYDEDRAKRVADDAAERAERKAVLDFEQRMRDRQEQVAQDMEKLKQKYEHELAIRDRDDKLEAMKYEQEKQKYVLDYLRHEISCRSEVDKARFDAVKEIETAKAQYDAQHAKDQLAAAEKRWQEQLKFDAEAAKRAEEYQKLLVQLQVDLEKIRHETQQIQSDNDAKVGVAQAQNHSRQEMAGVKQGIDRLSDKMDKRYRELHNDMDRIRNAQKNLENKVKELSKPQAPAAPAAQPQITWVPVQPAYPTAGGGYGYSKPLDISLTGGLGGMAQPVNPLAGTLQTPVNPLAGTLQMPVQPGMSGTCICPTCKKVCSSMAAVCEHCGNSI